MHDYLNCPYKRNTMHHLRTNETPENGTRVMCKQLSINRIVYAHVPNHMRMRSLHYRRFVVCGGGLRRVRALEGVGATGSSPLKSNVCCVHYLCIGIGGMCVVPVVWYERHHGFPLLNWMYLNHRWDLSLDIIRITGIYGVMTAVYCAYNK
eukprot:25889_1